MSLLPPLTLLLGPSNLECLPAYSDHTVIFNDGRKVYILFFETVLFEC